MTKMIECIARLPFAACAVTTMLLFVSAAPTVADEQPDEEGFISLFNGKDFTGWKISENGQWAVEDGCIVVSGKRAHLFTEKEFKNFEFKCEIMTEPRANSGVYFHTEYEDAFPKKGYECQVNCTNGDPVKNGSIYNVVKVYEPNAKDNEWYTMEIRVKGKNIVTKVNGKRVVDYTEPEGVTGTRKLSSGSMAIQAHDPRSVIRYRNIKIKPLPD